MRFLFTKEELAAPPLRPDVMVIYGYCPWRMKAMSDGSIHNCMGTKPWSSCMFREEWVVEHWSELYVVDSSGLPIEKWKVGVTDEGGRWGKESFTLQWRSPVSESESNDHPEIPFKGILQYVSSEFDPIPCFLRVNAIISPFSPLFLLIPTFSAPSGRSDNRPPIPLPSPLHFRSPRPVPRSL